MMINDIESIFSEWQNKFWNPFFSAPNRDDDDDFFLHGPRVQFSNTSLAGMMSQGRNQGGDAGGGGISLLNAGFSIIRVE